jgi:ElaB/YqjD/DUF883 family membrane-anchored ribosome-binding protein
VCEEEGVGLVYEEITVGITFVILALTAVVLLQLYRLGTRRWRSDMRQLEKMLGGLSGQIDKLEQRVSVLHPVLLQMLDDSQQWKRNLAAASQDSLNRVRKALASSMEESRRLARSGERAVERLDWASENMGRKLVASIDNHIGGTIAPQLTSLLDDLEKLIHRLEARGASPFKTAKAKILQNLLRKENIGGKHTSWEAALRGLTGPERESGSAALEDLIRMGLVVEKPTGYGRHVSLNAKRLKDTRAVINGEDI